MQDIPKADCWKCTDPECGIEFVTPQEEDESKVWCPFCKAEDAPIRIAKGVIIRLEGGGAA